MSSFLAVNPHTNQTVWIPFFIRAHRLPEVLRPYHTAFVACEALGHVYSLICCGFGMFVFYKVQAMHANLMQMILNSFYIGPPYILLRIPLLLMETGYWKYESMADDLIVLISIIRMWLFVDVYNFEVNIAIERYFALKYVRSYEKMKRRHISVIILSVNAVFAMIISYLITYHILHGFVYLAIVCLANNLALILFLNTARRNEAVRSDLIQFRKNDGSYTVSYRWQLHDNSRSARDLRILMIGCNGIISVILPILFVPALIFDHDASKSELLEVAKLFYQLSSAYVFGSSWLYLTFVIKKQRDFVFGKTEVEELSIVVEHPENRAMAETENHFNRLHEEWAVDMRRRESIRF